MKKFSRLFSFMTGLKYIETECRDFILDRVFCFVGEIEEHRTAGSSLITMEAGNWITQDKKPIRGTNAYRWTAADNFNLKLEHLRYGPAEPVLLLSFRRTGDDKWICKSSYICGTDSYSANLEVGENVMVLNWRIKGPDKNMQIKTRYSSAR